MTFALDLFVATGNAGTLTTSPDGTTWTSRTSGFGATIIQAAAWSVTIPEETENSDATAQMASFARMG